MISRIKNNRRKFLRRTVQIVVILILFSPALGYTFFRGTLISSTVFGIPLTDPVAAIDYMLAAKSIYIPLLAGFGIVLLFYFVVGGRAFCGWVCPIWLLSEYSAKLHSRFRIFSYKPNQNLRYYLLGIFFLLALVTSKPVFEIVSPIGIISQNISMGFEINHDVFGSSQALESGVPYGNIKENILTGEVESFRILINSSLWIIALLFLIDVFISKNFWCKYVCPVGGFYSLLGKRSPVKIKIDHDKCIQCDDCFNVCLVHEVLNDPVYGESDWVNDGSCTNCLDCIDVCPEKALNIGFKINRSDK